MRKWNNLILCLRKNINLFIVWPMAFIFSINKWNNVWLNIPTIFLPSQAILSVRRDKISLNPITCRNLVPLILVVGLDTSDQQHEGGHSCQVVGGQEGGAQAQGCNTMGRLSRSVLWANIISHLEAAPSSTGPESPRCRWGASPVDIIVWTLCK